MIVTTTQSIERQTIREYKGIVVGEAIMGANIVRDFFASITDVIVKYGSAVLARRPGPKFRRQLNIVRKTLEQS